MRRWLSVLLLLTWPTMAMAEALRTGRHITTQTTTTLVTGVAGQAIAIYSGSVCVDANGATTGVTFQDSTPTNLVGTSVVYVLSAGTCLWFPSRAGLNPYFNVTAAGKSLQIVTTVGNGPVEVYLEVVQQ